MKKILSVLTIILTISCFSTGCGSKILHCDGCNKELKVKQSSNMDEDWIILCSECEEDSLGDTSLLE